MCLKLKMISTFHDSNDDYDKIRSWEKLGCVANCMVHLVCSLNLFHHKDY